MAHRIRYLDEALNRITGREGVWQATAGEIALEFRKQISARYKGALPRIFRNSARIQAARRPKMPCGLKSRITTNNPNVTTCFMEPGMNMAPTDSPMPTISPPASASPRC